MLSIWQFILLNQRNGQVAAANNLTEQMLCKLIIFDKILQLLKLRYSLPFIPQHPIHQRPRDLDNEVAPWHR